MDEDFIMLKQSLDMASPQRENYPRVGKKVT